MSINPDTRHLKLNATGSVFSPYLVMKMQVVNSSEIAAVGYDSKTKILRALFVQGGLYEYADVPKKIYKQLLKAPSIGRFFNENIRNVDYPYRRID